MRSIYFPKFDNQNFHTLAELHLLDDVQQRSECYVRYKIRIHTLHIGGKRKKSATLSTKTQQNFHRT